MILCLVASTQGGGKSGSITTSSIIVSYNQTVTMMILSGLAADSVASFSGLDKGDESPFGLVHRTEH